MVAKSLSRALALILLFPPAALALGLGDIRLLSPLNAPLDAEIELIGATPDELASLKAQIASRETFARYGLDWPPFLSGVTVRTQRTPDGRDIIKLRSNDTITEPFVTLLVEVNWARGRLVREYTVLLDPPVYTPGQQETLNATISAPTTGAGEITREPATSAPAPATAPSSSAPAPVASGASGATGGNEVVVRRGDTLSKIASELSGADTRSWMLAIYQANPHAFDNNMNILRSGAVLRIPDVEVAAAIAPTEAAAEIRRQTAAWRASTPAVASTEGERGRLRLVTPSETGTGTGDSEQTQALQNRVRELEAQLEESRRLLELRNAELARLQERLAAAGQQPAAEAEVPVAEPPVAESAPTEGVPDELPVDEALAPPPPEETTAAAEPVEAEPEPAAAPVPSEPTPAPARVAATQDEGSIFDTLKSFWWVLLAVLAVLAALMGLKAWRARKQSEFDDSLGRLAAAGGGPIIRESSHNTEPLRAGPAGNREPAFVVEESGTHERPRFVEEVEPVPPPRNVASVPVDETISSETAINLDQGDPLAEADFHMAYGLYDQAADLVRIAIQREPERRDLRLKLLEVFFVWGNKEQFLQSAHEFAATRDQAAPGEWEKIVIMGKQLAPEDPLFSGGSGVSGAAAGGVDLNLEGGQSRVDFDLLGEPVPDGGGAGIDLDIGSALGDSSLEATASRATDSNLALHDPEMASATTRQMTAKMPQSSGDALADFDSAEAPTVEQPALQAQGDNPTIRTKVETALRQGGVPAEQTAELAIDDLGLDLTQLDTVDQPGLGSSPDAPTLVAGLDDHSRRVMEEAQRHGAGRAGDETVVSPTGSWRLSSEDLEPTMPPSTVRALENGGGDSASTSRLSALKDSELDFNFDAVDRGPSQANGRGQEVDLDVGTATVPDAAFTATQKLSSEDLALPDLEPVTMSEVGTKLDLARAYMDMGDPEGARNILEEVLQEGSVAQKQEAQRLLESLPG